MQFCVVDSPTNSWNGAVVTICQFGADYKCPDSTQLFDRTSLCPAETNKCPLDVIHETTRIFSETSQSKARWNDSLEIKIPTLQNIPTFSVRYSRIRRFFGLHRALNKRYVYQCTHRFHCRYPFQRKLTTAAAAAAAATATEVSSSNNNRSHRVRFG